MYNGQVSPVGQIKQNKIVISEYSRPRKGSYCQYKQEKLNRQASSYIEKQPTAGTISSRRNSIGFYDKKQVKRQPMQKRLQKYCSRELNESKNIGLFEGQQQLQYGQRNRQRSSKIMYQQQQTYQTDRYQNYKYDRNDKRQRYDIPKHQKNGGYCQSSTQLGPSKKYSNEPFSYQDRENYTLRSQAQLRSNGYENNRKMQSSINNERWQLSDRYYLPKKQRQMIRQQAQVNSVLENYTFKSKQVISGTRNLEFAPRRQIYDQNFYQTKQRFENFQQPQSPYFLNSVVPQRNQYKMGFNQTQNQQIRKEDQYLHSFNKKEYQGQTPARTKLEQRDCQQKLQKSRKDQLISKSKILRQKMNELSGDKRLVTSASRSTHNLATLNDEKRKQQSHQQRLERLRNNKERVYDSPFKQPTKSSLNLRVKMDQNAQPVSSFNHNSTKKNTNYQNYLDGSQLDRRAGQQNRNQAALGKFKVQSFNNGNDNECMNRISLLNNKINQKINSIISSYAK